MLVTDRAVRYYTSAFLLTLALQLTAIWLPAYNALTDYPIHIVRCHILANYDSSPFYQQLFDKSVLPNPNMAIDYLATPLVPILGLIAAGKVFLSCLIILFDIGCHLLGRVIHGGYSWTSLVCALLAFHGAYQYGFINYCFSVSLLLLCLALWYSQRDNWKLPALLFLSVLLTALFVAHLAGFGVAGLILLFFWVSEGINSRSFQKRMFLEAATFLPAVVIYVLLPRGHSVHVTAGLVEWPTLTEKLADCLTLLRCGNTPIDVLVALLLIAAGLLAFQYRGGHNNAVLRAGLFLYAVSLIMPRTFLVNSGGADVRLAIPGLLLCLISLQFPHSRRAMVLGLAILAVLGVRLAYQIEMFRRASLVTEAVVRLVDRVPSGVEFWMVCENQRILRQNLHAGDYGLARSGAISSNYYAVPFAQPLWFRKPLQGAAEIPEQLTDDLVRPTMARFRFAVVCGFPESRSKVLSPYASEVATSGPCSLWQTHGAATTPR